MKKIKDMHVKAKLKRSFLSVIGIASIAGLLAIILMLVIDARYGTALELNGFIQGDIGEYNAYLNKSGAFVRDVIMLDDATAKENLANSDAMVDYYFNELVLKLETAEERALIDFINEEYPQYIALRDEAVKMAEQGNKDEALEVFRKQAIPFLEEVMDAADKLIAMNIEMGDEISAYLSIISKVMVVVVLLVLVAAGFIGMKLATNTANEIHDSVEIVQNATEKLANGELDVHVQIDTQDEFGEMAVHFNDAVDKLKLYVDTIKYGLTEVGAGNFAVQPPIEFHGDFVALKDSIVHITRALSDTMREINNGSEEVAIGANHLAESAQNFAEGATTQAAAIQELTATIENVTTAAEDSAKQADEACKQAEGFAQLAEQSSKEMELLTQAMQRITDTSKEIESIIAEIEDIASQTNLLSLNASIEAARAGEAGRGFAVVADQIGKLAADSSQSAVNTNSLIAKSLQEINAGNEITARTVAALQEVIEGIRTLAVSAQGSREASVEQAKTMEEVQKGIIQIADVVQSNSASAEETSATSEELSAQSQNLKAMVDQFILLD